MTMFVNLPQLSPFHS